MVGPAVLVRSLHTSSISPVTSVPPTEPFLLADHTEQIPTDSQTSRTDSRDQTDRQTDAPPHLSHCDHDPLAAARLKSRSY
jgi:hypothetical protein